MLLLLSSVEFVTIKESGVDIRVSHCLAFEWYYVLLFFQLPSKYIYNIYQYRFIFGCRILIYFIIFAWQGEFFINYWICYYSAELIVYFWLPKCQILQLFLYEFCCKFPIKLAPNVNKGGNKISLKGILSPICMKIAIKNYDINFSRHFSSWKYYLYISFKRQPNIM